jgi:uncharacterized protein YcfJ
MKKVFVLSLVSASSLLAFNASAQDILARVLSSTPVVQQVAVPRQVCNNQQVVTQTPKSGGGAFLGAIAGGAAGNAVGPGGGKALATMIGLVGGAIVGDRIEGGGSQLQNVQQCSTQTFYENRASHYNVVYEYQGTQYNVQMQQDPGPYVKLQVTPVGAMAPGAAPQPGFAQPPATSPQTLLQQEPVPYAAQPGYVVQQPVYAGPVVVQSAPVYYGQPYYARPYYGPSISLGFSRSYGYGHSHGRGHWR